MTNSSSNSRKSCKRRFGNRVGRYFLKAGRARHSVRAVSRLLILFAFSFENTARLIQPSPRPRKLTGQNCKPHRNHDKRRPRQEDKRHANQENGSPENCDHNFPRPWRKSIQPDRVMHLLKKGFVRDCFHLPISHRRLLKKIGVKPGASEWVLQIERKTLHWIKYEALVAQRTR